MDMETNEEIDKTFFKINLEFADGRNDVLVSYWHSQFFLESKLGNYTMPPGIFRKFMAVVPPFGCCTPESEQQPD